MLQEFSTHDRQGVFCHGARLVTHGCVPGAYCLLWMHGSIDPLWERSGIGLRVVERGCIGNQARPVHEIGRGFHSVSLPCSADDREMELVV